MKIEIVSGTWYMIENFRIDIPFHLFKYFTYPEWHLSAILWKWQSAGWQNRKQVYEIDESMSSADKVLRFIRYQLLSGGRALDVYLLKKFSPENLSNKIAFNFLLSSLNFVVLNLAVQQLSGCFTVVHLVSFKLAIDPNACLIEAWLTFSSTHSKLCKR